jgi:hypothetical protein
MSVRFCCSKLMTIVIDLVRLARSGTLIFDTNRLAYCGQVVVVQSFDNSV